MKSPRVYVDITDFLTWTGNFTGIQRTFYSIVKELEKQHITLELVVFADGKYQLLHQNIENILKVGVKRRKIRLKQTREERFRKELKSFYENLPQYLRVPSTPLMIASRFSLNKLIPVGHTALHRVRLARTALGFKDVVPIANQKKSVNLYGPSVSLSEQDTLMVLSCIWDSYEHLSYVADLVAHKKPTLHCLVYDLIPIYASYAFGDGLADIYARYIFEILTLSTKVFAISQATADDLKRFMSETGIVSDVRIETVRLGDTLPGKNSKEFDEMMDSKYPKPFAISVGTIEARKNHVQLYAALKLALQNGYIQKLPHIYIIGRIGWLAEEVARFLDLDPELEKYVTILTDVSDNELAWFYRHAQFSVYTSQYEGWGLPVAESFVYGTPCIVSNVSSMREIAPSLSKFVSPYDSGELLEAMLEYSDKVISAAQRKKIRQSYKSTAWSQAAKPIIEALRVQKINDNKSTDIPSASLI